DSAPVARAPQRHLAFGLGRARRQPRDARQVSPEGEIAMPWTAQDWCPRRVCTVRPPTSYVARSPCPPQIKEFPSPENEQTGPATEGRLRTDRRRATSQTAS